MSKWKRVLAAGVATATLFGGAATVTACGAERKPAGSGEPPSAASATSSYEAPAASGKGRAVWRPAKRHIKNEDHFRNASARSDKKGAWARIHVEWKDCYATKKDCVSLNASAWDKKKGDRRGAGALLGAYVKTKRGWKWTMWLVAHHRGPKPPISSSGVLRSRRPVKDVWISACLMKKNTIVWKSCSAWK